MILVVLFMIISSLIGATSYGIPVRFDQSFSVTEGKTPTLEGGQVLDLNLNNASGSSALSLFQISHGKIDMHIKLPGRKNVGIATEFILASEGQAYDGIGFKFVAKPLEPQYTMETNVISQGKRYRAQQFRLWFDPTEDFNTYSIFWNTRSIIFYVNDVPIRVFDNMESSGVPYPNKQPMRVSLSVYKIGNWPAPKIFPMVVKPGWTMVGKPLSFKASFRNFKFGKVCFWTGKYSICGDGHETSSVNTKTEWLNQQLGTRGLRMIIKGIQDKYMIYNYCTDRKIFPTGFPSECKAS